MTIDDEVVLLRRAALLGDEATKVYERLGLEAILARAGEVERVGSSVMGLMVWRDLDVVVHAPGLGQSGVIAALEALFDDRGLLSLDYRDERRSNGSASNGVDSRHYVVLRHEGVGRGTWKIDVTFWTARHHHDHDVYAKGITDRLTDESRLAILRIKDAWYQRPSYPYTVGGHDVYVAVLDHGVRTVDGFERYLLERGLPTE